MQQETRNIFEKNTGWIILTRSEIKSTSSAVASLSRFLSMMINICQRKQVEKITAQKDERSRQRQN